MIRMNFVNDVSTFDYGNVFTDFDSFMEHFDDDINYDISELKRYEDLMLFESVDMGDSNSKYIAIYEEKKTNFVEKIGQKLIDLAKKFGEMINKFIERIKSFSFSKKSDVQKLETLQKKYPSLANDAKIAFDSGALKLSDMKSIKEMDDSFDAVIKQMRKQEIDPKSARGKIEAIKEKFSKAFDDKSTGVKVLKVVGAVGGAITAIKLIQTYKSAVTQAHGTAVKANAILSEDRAKAIIKAYDKGEINNGMSPMEVELLAKKYTAEGTTRMLTHDRSVIEKLGLMISKMNTAIESRISHQTHDYVGNAREVLKDINNEKEADIRRQSTVKLKFDEDNAERLREVAKNIAHSQAVGRDEGTKKPTAEEEIESSSRKAYGTIKGQLNAGRDFARELSSKEFNSAMTRLNAELKHKENNEARINKLTKNLEHLKNELRNADDLKHKQKYKNEIEGLTKDLEKAKAQGRDIGSADVDYRNRSYEQQYGKREADDDYNIKHPKTSTNTNP